MGVPGLFLWLLKKYDYDNLLTSIDRLKGDVDNLLIDTNCLLHPKCFETISNNSDITNINTLENLMIENCINYIEKLIQFIEPKELVYISIDGVAPYAKIKQQRLRRFKSAKDKRLYNNLKKKFKKDRGCNWTNASITPGTVFMDKLDRKIKEYIKSRKDNLKIIYSSCYIEAEGEHKLLQYIRNNNTYDKKNVIYGLDADLIFLSLATLQKNIYLLREAQVIDKNSKEILTLVSIDIIKDYILDEFIYSINSEIELDKDNIINDFIFICFFLGNDFLPHLPSISLYSDKKLMNGLDLIIYCYCKSFKLYNNYIIKKIDDKIIFNEEFIINFLDNLILFEKEYFHNLYNSKKKRRFCRSNDPYEREVFKIDNLQFKIKDNIELGKDSDDLWKYRYYNTYYKASNNMNNTIEDACFDFFKGLVWNSYYYFYKCPCWTWYYKFNHGPFISDVRGYIKNFNFNKVEFKLEKPLKPLYQLFCVLPPQYAFLLPKSYKFLVLNNKSPLIYLYPKDVDLDMINKNKYWQCIPYLPNMDFELIKILDKFKLTEDEKKRNRSEKLFIKN
tara:strand:+ start:263 stop:1945 length:1683 start_codon:yes stop_codon:yes gene_type:complete